MTSSRAGSAEPKAIEIDSLIPPSPRNPQSPPDHVDDNGQVVLTKDKVMLAAAKLFGQGYDHNTVARVLCDHLITPDARRRPMDQKLQRARSKLRRWRYNDEFRDLVYQHAIVELDMDSPKILKSVSRKARKGNIMAARLALEVSGRHNPKGEAGPTQVVVAFAGVPRPGDAGSAPVEEVIEVEAEEV